MGRTNSLPDSITRSGTHAPGDSLSESISPETTLVREGRDRAGLCEQLRLPQPQQDRERGELTPCPEYLLVEDTAAHLLHLVAGYCQGMWRVRDQGVGDALPHSQEGTDGCPSSQP